MKSAVMAITLLATLAAPALAGPCDADLAALKTRLAQSSADADVKTQVQDMVTQADKLCAAGNEDEAADVISDASSMLTQ